MGSATVLGAEADQLEQLGHPCRDVTGAAADHERLRDRGARGEARVERGVGVLEHDLHPVAQRAEGPTGRGAMSSPSTRIAPAVGSSNRTRRLASVDLPQPDSPTSASVSPGPRAKLTPSTACTSRRRVRGIP